MAGKSHWALNLAVGRLIGNKRIDSGDLGSLGQRDDISCQTDCLLWPLLSGPAPPPDRVAARRPPPPAEAAPRPRLRPPSRLPCLAPRTHDPHARARA